MSFAKRLSLVAVVASLALVGCKQGEGETCQLDSDCEGSLECDLGQGGERFCMDPEQPDPPDAAVPTVDAGPNTPDAVSTPDAGGIDAP